MKKELAAYGISGIITVGLLFHIVHLGQLDLKVPFRYDSDALWFLIQIRACLDYGSYLHNPDLGAPFGCDLHDLPSADSLHFFQIRVLHWLGFGPLRATNLFFLWTFPLTTWTTYYVFRQFGRSREVSVCGAVMYAFLPYHFLKNINHLFLSAYYMVPLLLMVCLWICSESGLRSSQVLPAIGICVLTGCAGIYYGYFSCFFLLVAGALRATASAPGRGRALRWSVILSGVIVVVGVWHVLPNIQYIRENGRNEFAHRHPADVETFSLRLGQMAVPIPFHRWSTLAQLRAGYDTFHLPYEVNTAACGILICAGFLYLLVRLFAVRPQRPDPLEQRLAHLNLAGFLLATNGGIGSVVALLAFSSIRVYVRMCVFLSFFALMALAGLYDRAQAALLNSPSKQAILYRTLCMIFILGILDETSPGLWQNESHPEQAARQCAVDTAFVRQIEARLAPGAMVFQLPVATFPEPNGRDPVPDYDHFRLYLHSHKLRWSYGAVKGRRGAAWQQALASRPVAEGLSRIALAGYGGIYINRKGMPDRGKTLEGAFQSILKGSPLVSEDGQMSFFDLTGVQQLLEKTVPKDELTRRRAAALEAGN